MPSQREPIFHDRQFVIDQVLQSTTSSTFVDITNAVLTTKDLGQSASYDIFFSVSVSVYE